jgi:hypothetical protein
MRPYKKQGNTEKRDLAEERGLAEKTEKMNL